MVERPLDLPRRGSAVELTDFQRRRGSLFLRDPRTITSQYEKLVEKAYDPAKYLLRSASQRSIGSLGSSSDVRGWQPRYPSYYSSGSSFSARSPFDESFARPRRDDMFRTSHITTWTYPIWKYLHEPSAGARERSNTSDPARAWPSSYLTNPHPLIRSPSSSSHYIQPYEVQGYARTYNQARSQHNYQTRLAGNIDYHRSSMERADDNYRRWGVQHQLFNSPSSRYMDSSECQWRTPYRPPSTRNYISAIYAS